MKPVVEGAGARTAHGTIALSTAARRSVRCAGAVHTRAHLPLHSRAPALNAPGCFNSRAAPPPRCLHTPPPLAPDLTPP